MSGNDVLPLAKISIFSSGLAYYEHSGLLTDSSVINLPFKAETLRSLKIDLSENPDMAAILGKLRGAEVEAAVPSPVSGRIVGIEYRPRSVSSTGEQIVEPWISLYTNQGIKMFSLVEINTLHFKDPELSGDLERAMDL